MASTQGRRALHYVLKIGNRRDAVNFCKEILGMQVLRHEEFKEGCAATCNGPYDGKWSKTMFGYGPEDSHFVLELTYNYGISEYRHGNDFVGIDVLKKDMSKVIEAGAVAKLKKLNVGNTIVDAYAMKTNGYRFNIIQDGTGGGDKISRVTLASSDMTKTMNFYTKVLGMKQIDNYLTYSEAGTEDHQCKFQFHSRGGKLDRGHAFGRIAFACPTNQLKEIEASARKSVYGESVQTPLVTLPTPGKADVEVVVIADPDGHEICFVGDEGFHDLSRVDPEGDKLLGEAIAADKSDEWFAKKGKEKGKEID